MISVVIPVYKVEAYIDQCVQSIVDQTYTDLEIILVDDGSPDNCPAMCDAWAEKDSRIKVIHKENGGLSDARNAGMTVATGDFIGFVDSDDYIAEDMYKQLLDHLIDTDSDISACGVEQFWEDGRRALLTSNGTALLENRQAMEAIVKETWLKQPVWYKLYKRSMVEGISFERGKCHEDVFWSYQPIARANRVYVFDTPLYFYRQREGSIMGTQFSEKRLDALEAKVQRLEFLRKSYPELAETAQNGVFFFAMYLMQLALRGKNCPSDVLEKIEKYANEYPVKPQTRKERVWSAMAQISFSKTCWLRNLLHIGL